jgi:hypothetical protein
MYIQYSMFEQTNQKMQRKDITIMSDGAAKDSCDNA